MHSNLPATTTIVKRQSKPTSDQRNAVVKSRSKERIRVFTFPQQLTLRPLSSEAVRERRRTPGEWQKRKGFQRFYRPSLAQAVGPFALGDERAPA